MNLTESQLPNEARWKVLAGHTCRRINLAWWWQGAAPVLAGIAGVGCAVILFLRSTHHNYDEVMAALILGGLCLSAALGAWMWARRRFASVADGMVIIEDRLKLNNALTAAASGVGTWPEAPSKREVNDGIAWKWTGVIPPTLLFLACLGLAFLLPIEAPVESISQPVPPPSALQSAENMIRELEKSDAARQEELEKFQQALDVIKQRNPEEWYNHASLEAADHLKESLKREGANLANNYDKAGNSLEKLSKDSSDLTPAAKQQAAKELANALEGLQNGGLKPNEKLMEKLNGLDPGKLAQQLSKEEMEELRQQLKKNAKAAKKACEGQCEGAEGSGGEGSAEQAMRDALDKEGAGGGGEQGEEEGNSGDGAKGKEGPGDVSRGPGTVDLKPRKKDSEDLQTSNPEKAQTRDLSRLARGDLLGTSDGEHNVDKTSSGPQSGGATENQGQGGDAVHRENLLPGEKRVLRRFFK